MDEANRIHRQVFEATRSIIVESKGISESDKEKRLEIINNIKFVLRKFKRKEIIDDFVVGVERVSSSPGKQIWKYIVYFTKGEMIDNIYVSPENIETRISAELL